MTKTARNLTYIFIYNKKKKDLIRKLELNSNEYFERK